MSDIRIEIATLSDAPAVTTLFERSYSRLLVGEYDAKTLDRAMAFLAHTNPDLLGSGTYYLAKTADGALAGSGGWTMNRPGTKDDVSPGVAHVRHFAVDPDHTRKGIARALFDRCVADAKQTNGVHRFECYSTLSAQRFYEKLGFEVIGEFAAPFAPDFSFPSLHMRCDLMGN